MRPHSQPECGGGAASVEHVGQRTFRIRSRTIGSGAPVFVIAEIGLNHDGDAARARELIDRAVDAGADCVKFQMRSLPTLYTHGANPDDPRADLSVQYVLDVVRRAELRPDDLSELFTYARSRGVEALCTPWDIESLGVLDSFGMPAFKVASADLTNHELLERIAATGKPLLVSTGMSQDEDIRETVSVLERCGAEFAVLHCIAAYPPPFAALQLDYIRRLQVLAGCRPVGYSGHETGWIAPVAAVALGATIIEKHFTLDRQSPGNDHKISLLPGEFRDMVTAIRQVEEALGGGETRRLCHGERINHQALGKSLVAARSVRRGEMITSEMIAVRSPGCGVKPSRRAELVGQRASRDIEAHEAFFDTDLDGGLAVPASVPSFRRCWGIPVRYHDVLALTSRLAPALVEFHMSYKDLSVPPERFLQRTYPCRFSVHSPEQFDDDVVLDLASNDARIRRRSSEVLQTVIDRARSLTAYFPSTPRPFVIANVGGFSTAGFMLARERRQVYERIAEGLNALDAQGVELLPQTLPPFPWFFGGRHFANVFVDPEETVWFCHRYGYRVCLDAAHTHMAARYAGQRSQDFFECLAPYTAHVHVSDARGVDGEGLQIGEGEIDFGALAESLDRLAPEASFIAEIWEGHWNAGYGFALALERLAAAFGETATSHQPRAHGDVLIDR